MATTSEQGGVDRRHATRERIDNLLKERQEMWVLYERLAGVSPDDGEPHPEQLHRFVQLLVDYIAAGHFGLYERIVSGQERRKGVLTLAEELYPKISVTTEMSVKFNDKYADEEPTEMTDELNRDLSALGEVLATRTELEDQLIEKLFEPK